jgi:heat shock protein HtpX
MIFFSRFPAPAVLLLAPLLFALALVGPALSRLLAMTVSREREYHADAFAVELTRNPSGLTRALRKIAQTRSPLRGATRGTAHMFIVNPLRRRGGEGDSRWADLFSTHPPLDHRIAILDGRAA